MEIVTDNAPPMTLLVSSGGQITLNPKVTREQLAMFIVRDEAADKEALAKCSTIVNNEFVTIIVLMVALAASTSLLAHIWRTK